MPNGYGHDRAFSNSVKKQWTTLDQESKSFPADTVHEHRLLKTSVWRQIRSTRLQVMLSLPLIYACVIPFLLLDVVVVIYQSICFPIYGIPKVRRSDYLIFDRGFLAYLNAIEKIGCVYCSYANGLLAYVTEVAARTEKHFCPIKHSRPVVQPHSQYVHFLPYGDARGYQTRSKNQKTRADAGLMGRSKLIPFRRRGYRT